MAVDLNLLNAVTHVRPDTFEGGQGWTWVSDQNDMTWQFICQDWVTHHKRTITSLFPNKGRTVVQAGGNCGLYPALLSQYFAVVYSFEPDPVHFHCLTNNCQFPNIIKMQAALGEAPGMAQISARYAGNTGMTQVATINGVDAIPVLTLDSFTFKELDLIWLDTEGFEQKILRGGLQTLKDNNPKLLLELGDVVDGKPGNVQRVVDMLAEIGYSKVSRTGGEDYLIERE